MKPYPFLINPNPSCWSSAYYNQIVFNAFNDLFSLSFYNQTEIDLQLVYIKNPVHSPVTIEIHISTEISKILVT